MSIPFVRHKPSLLQRLSAVFTIRSRRKYPFSKEIEGALRRNVRIVRDATSKIKDPVAGRQLMHYYLQWALANYIRKSAPFLLKNLQEKAVNR